MRRPVLLVATLLVLSGLAPQAGHATHCNSKLEIWTTWGSGTTVAPALPNTVSIECNPAFPPQDAYNTRVIVPGATHVGAGYSADFGPGWPNLTLVLNGLGFSNASFDLTRTLSGVSYVYTGGYWPIPDAPVVQGTLTATIMLPTGAQTVTHHTIP